MSVDSNDGWVTFTAGFFAGVFIGTCMFAYIGWSLGTVSGKEQGAIAAHKGEIVCVQLVFKEERWECGEL